MRRCFRGDQRADPDGGYVHDRTPMLDGAYPGDGQLLNRLVSEPEGGVVGLDEQDVGTVVDGVPDQSVVGHLEADDGACGDRPPATGRYPKHTDRLTRGEILVDQIDLVAEVPE